jgi:hypothetical protein
VFLQNLNAYSEEYFPATLKARLVTEVGTVTKKVSKLKEGGDVFN